MKRMTMIVLVLAVMGSMLITGQTFAMVPTEPKAAPAKPTPKVNPAKAAATKAYMPLESVVRDPKADEHHAMLMGLFREALYSFRNKTSQPNATPPFEELAADWMGRDTLNSLIVYSGTKIVDVIILTGKYANRAGATPEETLKRLATGLRTGNGAMVAGCFHADCGGKLALVFRARMVEAMVAFKTALTKADPDAVAPQWNEELLAVATGMGVAKTRIMGDRAIVSTGGIELLLTKKDGMWLVLDSQYMLIGMKCAAMLRKMFEAKRVAILVATAQFTPVLRTSAGAVCTKLTKRLAELTKVPMPPGGPGATPQETLKAVTYALVAGNSEVLKKCFKTNKHGARVLETLALYTKAEVAFLKKMEAAYGKRTSFWGFGLDAYVEHLPNYIFSINGDKASVTIPGVGWCESLVMENGLWLIDDRIYFTKSKPVADIEIQILKVMQECCERVMPLIGKKGVTKEDIEKKFDLIFSKKTGTNPKLGGATKPAGKTGPADTEGDKPKKKPLKGW